MAENSLKNREKIEPLASRLDKLAIELNSGLIEDNSTKVNLDEYNSFNNNFSKIFININKSKQIELKTSFYEYAIRYSRMRVDQIMADVEQKKMLDEERTRAHNAFIDACNILSRNMIKNREDAFWRKELGDDRKIIGDFACYINYVLGIRAR